MISYHVVEKVKKNQHVSNIRKDFLVIIIEFSKSYLTVKGIIIQSLKSIG